jgi:hypothetical protein
MLRKRVNMAARAPVATLYAAPLPDAYCTVALGAAAIFVGAAPPIATVTVGLDAPTEGRFSKILLAVPQLEQGV